LNGEAAKSTGHVVVRTMLGDPDTPADEADVAIKLVDTDVREAADLSDYTGEVAVSLGLRITERDGPTPASGGAAPVTQQDFYFTVSVPCAPTADTTVGATCATTTRADAVLPGVISEKRRTIWALDQVRVFDGGADGDAATSADNRVFQVQGVFVP
jgi:hypothetical protein